MLNWMEWQQALYSVAYTVIDIQARIQWIVITFL